MVSLLSGAGLDWRYNSGVQISLEDAKHESDCIAELMDAQGITHCRLLIDVREIGSISRRARRYFASKEVHDVFGVQGLALIIGSPIGTMVGNLYFSLNRTHHPTRLFAEREPALTWLRGL